MKHENLIQKKTFSFLLLLVLTLISCDLQNKNAANVVLQSATHDIRLSDYHNKLILLSFGYTHCPDVCPATLAHVSQALDLLSTDEKKRVQAIFVSLDPARDSPKDLGKYVKFFHDDLLGVTADENSLKTFMKAFQIESFKLSDDEDYEISHTSYLFLVDHDANVLDMMGHQTTADSIVAAIQAKL